MDRNKCPMRFLRDDESDVCIRNRCEWWVQPRTTAGHQMSGVCAVVMLAMKNQDGRYSV